jgi:DNA-binding MarR family transcriptional regulator
LGALHNNPPFRDGFCAEQRFAQKVFGLHKKSAIFSAPERSIMGFLTDLLKDLPLTSVLREKIATFESENAALQTEVAILKDDKRKLEAENKRLKDEIKSFTHTDDLHETEIKILVHLANLDGSDDEENIVASLKLGQTRTDYFLQSLWDKDYIRRSAVLMSGQEVIYYLEQKGREYLIKNDLI